MKIKCPICGSTTTELMECDVCGSIGCSRCIHKKSDKWICHTCEKEPEKKTYDLFSMFG